MLPKLTQINAFLKISDQISTAGQPNEAEFLAIKISGHETVINLALEDSPRALSNESQILADLDLEYIHLPVQWEAPTPADALRFFEIMNQHQYQRIFVHCAANKRVSVFVYLYRVLCLGEDAAIAQDTMHQIWEPNPIWQNFIDRMLAQFYPRKAPSL